MGSTILTLFKELNGYKYIIAISVAVVGSWYDIKGEIKELRHDAEAIKQTATSRVEHQKEKDKAQEEAILRIHDEILAEIRILRNEMTIKHK